MFAYERQYSQLLIILYCKSEFHSMYKSTQNYAFVHFKHFPFISFLNTYLISIIYLRIKILLIIYTEENSIPPL